MSTRIVVALGGNALMRRGEPVEDAVQQRNAALAADALAEVAPDQELIVTHGNGPQVGLLALQSAAFEGVSPYPLDVLGAETEGMVGYLLERELRNRLGDREVVTLLTQTEVDADDPAFERPTKPIGPLYDEEGARRVEKERGWRVARDGRGFRRVVPSPEPRRILELAAIELLVDAGAVVICGGGGGIPVTIEAGALRGVEAVIDKDLASSLLALELKADALLLLTDVDAVYRDWGAPGARPIQQAGAREMRRLKLEEGTMAPKVEAACRFAEATGNFAAIGELGDAAILLRREAGTVIVP